MKLLGTCSSPGSVQIWGTHTYREHTAATGSRQLTWEHAAVDRPQLWKIHTGPGSTQLQEHAAMISI